MSQKKSKTDNDVRVVTITTIGTIIVALITALVAPSVLKLIDKTPALDLTTLNSPTSTIMVQSPTTSPAPMITQIEATPTPDGYYDDFSQGSKWLEVKTFSDSYAWQSMYVKDSIYHWDIRATEGAVFGALANIEKFADFEFEVSFKRVIFSDPTNLYGVSFRGTDDSTYYFYLTSDGKYKITRYLWKEEKFGDPVKRTASPIINLEGKNTLKVVAQGNSLHFYINGKLVERVIDNLYGPGHFRLSVIMGPSETLDMEVDRFSVIPITSPSPMDTWPTQFSEVQSAMLQLSGADDGMTVLVNGQEAASADYGDESFWIPFQDYLKQGDNQIEIIIRNGEARGNCGGEFRMKLNDIVNMAYQKYLDRDEAQANTECFHETITLPLK
jgi:hypothetical protein